MAPKDKCGDQKEWRASPTLGSECLCKYFLASITVLKISVRAKVCAVMGISNAGGGSERAM